MVQPRTHAGAKLTHRRIDDVASPDSRARIHLPDLNLEHQLIADGATVVAGMDEVGRGAIAGPVSVGVVLVDAQTPPCPPGVRDSKLMTPAARARVREPIGQWARAWAVGHASPLEIDEVGIIEALRRAGRRALAAASQQAGPVSVVVLDGTHDWLSLEADFLPTLDVPHVPALDRSVRVVTRAKADLTCASVAAASVMAKCVRDELMVALACEHPGFGWERNKGYGSAGHRDGIATHGLTAHHRRSWNLTR